MESGRKGTDIPDGRKPIEVGLSFDAINDAGVCETPIRHRYL
jgi:hypothetical protein